MSVPTRADRFEAAALICIVLAVGLMAGAASFTHTRDWTLLNSPDGTPEWFGWANAVISELTPVAALIEIGRRRRIDAEASVVYPMLLLLGSVGFSLTAQIAVAKPGPSGWMVSALPSLAFFALTKLVFARTAKRATVPSPGTRPQPTETAPEPAAERPLPEPETVVPQHIPEIAPGGPIVPSAFLPPAASHSRVNGFAHTGGAQ